MSIKNGGARLSDDDDHLRVLGYEPQLERKMGLIANFALGFVYLSPMVGVVAIFAMGLTAAGPPAMFWILIVAAGQGLVALVFGEIVSQFPLAGGLYQWARRLWSGRYAWWMSWIYIACITIGITTTALFSADFMASLDRKSTRLNSSHVEISYAVFCLKKKRPRSPNTASSWSPRITCSSST